MKLFLKIALLVFSLLGSAWADVLVLVHGYASDARTWERSGVNHALRQAGWQHRWLVNTALPLTGKSFYTVNLPAHESLWIQNSILQDTLKAIRQHHPNENLTLAGHSAGGLVARMAVLRGNPAGVDRLVTIASPHLGTPRAIDGLDFVHDVPVFCPGPGWRALKSFFGGDDYDYLKQSRRALIDMTPAGSRNLIDWANTQVHPDIEYHAIVRQIGDKWVPPMSQDLNSVPSISGKAYVWPVRSSHFLHPADGVIILQILNGDFVQQ